MELGDTTSMNNLGKLYIAGAGVEKNYSKARELFEQAASLGDKDAVTYLKFIEEKLDE